MGLNNDLALDICLSYIANKNKRSGFFFMKVKVLFFASCSDIVGCKEAEKEITEGATLGSFKKDLMTQYPDLLGLKNVLSVAVNTEYADDFRVLKAGDEIAFIPPVSGG